MKKLLFFLLILTSCAKPLFVSQILEQSKTDFISFQKYTDKGFLFTLSTFNGNYEGKGMVSCDIFPQYNYEKDESSMLHPIKTTSDYTVDLYRAMDAIYDMAIKVGADGVIDLKIEQITKTYEKPTDLNDDFVIREYMNPEEIVSYESILKHPHEYVLFDQMVIIGIKVSGFAIKRLQ